MGIAGFPSLGMPLDLAELTYLEHVSSVFRFSLRVPWSGTDPYAKMNCFTWSKEDNDWIVSGDQYNKEFKNCKGSIHNDQFCSQTLKEKRKTEETCSRYAGSAKFNGIPR